MKSYEPWRGGDYTLITDYFYVNSAASLFNGDVAQVVRKLRPVAGWLMTTLSTETHSYAVSGGVKSEEEFLLLSDGTTWVRLSGATHSYTYNQLGQLTQVTDAAGIRSIGYNTYGEQETDSLLAGGKTHLITETRDALHLR